MLDLISKKISFSEPELESDGSLNGYIGLSIIPIQKNSIQHLTNISLTKESDSSFEKIFGGIDLLDFSSNPVDYVLARDKYFKTLMRNGTQEHVSIYSTGILEEDPPRESPWGIDLTKAEFQHRSISFPDGRFPYYETFESSNELTETLQAYISKKILYKFKSVIQSIDTILTCDLYHVKSDFIYTLFSELGSTIILNNSPTSLFNLKSKSLTRNYLRKTPDYKILVNQKNFIPFTDSDSLEYITTISTSLISNYSYTLPVNNSYDFILLLPSCSKKSFSGSDESFKEFESILTDGKLGNSFDEIKDWSKAQKDFSTKFSTDLDTFLNNFEKKITQASLKDSFSVIKDVQGIFNCNLLTEVSQ